MLSIPSKLMLGTAQFGSAYGVANTQGRPDLNTVQDILNLARSRNIQSLDTAILYGDSESVLGEVGVQGFKVSSKLPAMPVDPGTDAERWVTEQVAGSLKRLKIHRLDALFLHRPGQLLQADGARLYQAMQQQKKWGYVRRIGVSIYDPSELSALLAHFDLDVVQAPLNVLDDRMRQSGWLDRLHKKGVALHVRSIFLQGLLLMPSAVRPAYFQQWDTLWARWEAWLDEHHLSALQACLRHALHVEEVEKVVLGVDNVVQLGQVLTVACEGPLPDGGPQCQASSLDLLDPSRWKTT